MKEKSEKIKQFYMSTNYVYLEKKKEVKAKCTQKTNYNIHYRQQQLTIPILQNWQINN